MFSTGGGCCLRRLLVLLAELVILNGMCNWSCAVMRSLVAQRNVGRDTEREGGAGPSHDLKSLSVSQSLHGTTPAP